LHIFHDICLGFLFEIVLIVGPLKEHRLVSERRVGPPIPSRRVQYANLHMEKPAKESPCNDLSATKSVPSAVSGRIFF